MHMAKEKKVTFREVLDGEFVEGGVLQSGAPRTIAKLVHITPMSLWFMVPITIVFMGFINQLITGGAHIAWCGSQSQSWVVYDCFNHIVPDVVVEFLSKIHILPTQYVRTFGFEGVKRCVDVECGVDVTKSMPQTYHLGMVGIFRPFDVSVYHISFAKYLTQLNLAYRLAMDGLSNYQWQMAMIIPKLILLPNLNITLKLDYTELRPASEV